LNAVLQIAVARRVPERFRGRASATVGAITNAAMLAGFVLGGMLSTLLSTLGGIGMWAVVVVLPAVQAEFAVGRGDASLPYTLTMIGFALGNLVVGRFIDRFGFMWPGIIAALVMGFGFILAALTSSVTQFALIQGVMIGVGSSATFGPLIADISHWFDRRRGVAVGVAASGNYLAGAVWPIGMQGFLVSDGWRATYIGIGVICIAAMVPLLLLLRRRHPRNGHGHAEGPASKARIQPISVSPPVLQALLVIAGVACCVAMSMPQVHIVAYCGDLGYGVARGAEMLSIMMAFGMTGQSGGLTRKSAVMIVLLTIGLVIAGAIAGMFSGPDLGIFVVWLGAVLGYVGGVLAKPR
jgi:MFS family permease